MNRASFWRDDRGAIMYLALVFAIFAVAMIYCCIGVTQAALHRQHMQDGADASALSGAIMQARSMNLLVLLNIVMAALLSVLVALKLVEAVAIAAIIIATAAAYPTFGASLALLPPFELVRSEVKTLHDSLEEPILEAIDAVHELSDVVQEVAPSAAEGVATASASGAVNHVLVGIESALPVEDDSYKRLCEEAGELPIALAGESLPLPASGVLKKCITNPLSEAMGAMAKTFSNWFCGDEGDGSPPPYELTQEVWYPQEDLGEACGQTATNVMNQDIESLASDETFDCAARAAAAVEAAPHPATGECLQNCGVDGPYEQRVQLAREICDPAVHRYERYAYQERSGSVEYAWDGDKWKRGEPSFDGAELKESVGRPPCGDEDGAVSPDYNRLVRDSDDASEVLPVCSNEALLVENLSRGYGGSTTTIDFIEVRHILACAEEATTPIEVEGEPPEDSGSRRPKCVKTDLTLGAEAFQVRVVGMGAPDLDQAERVVRLALWNKPSGPDPLAELRQFSGSSLAQAEYFYDEDTAEDTGRDQWMWNMNWKARLVRFRADEAQLEPLFAQCDGLLGEAPGEVAESGALPVDACRPFLEKVLELGPLITH